MADNKQNAISPSEQIKLAKVLLYHYDTWHTVFDEQMKHYTIACCNIALPGIVKVDHLSKTVIYEIKTEKKYKFADGKTIPTKISKITQKKYDEEKKIIKMNLEDWTKKLLWGDITTIRVYIDGTEA